jgi:hypothetical protein
MDKLESELKESLKSGKGANTSATTASNKVDEIKKLLTAVTQF